MTNRIIEDSTQSRSQTAPGSSVSRSTMKLSQGRLYRTESAPLYGRYVPSLYRNPDPEITRKLEAFLFKPLLNSPGNFGTSKSSNSENSQSSEKKEFYSRQSLAYDNEVAERFKHLLPEKRTIQQMMLPPIMEGCRENFNHGFKPQSNEDEDFTEDLSEKFIRLRYCRYLRPGPNFNYGYQTSTKEKW